MRLVSFAIALAVLASPFRARAQEGSLEDAKRYAAEAKVHYDLGEYDAAAEAYQKVYRIKPLPALLYNIAQSYRQAGHYEKARQFYKSYLREAKDAPNRGAIEKAIREIDELLAKEQKAKNGPPKGIAQTPPVSSSALAVGSGLSPPAAPATARGSIATRAQPGVAESLNASAPPTSASAQAAPQQAALASGKTAVPSEAVVGNSVQPASSNRRTYAYITAGAAVAFIGGGVLFASRASKYEDELNARPHPQATIDDLSSTAKSSRTLSLILLGAGAAAGIGAGLLYFLPSGDGFAVQGRF
jgi:tetratricopeptide (TPR) repeat protein